MRIHNPIPKPTWTEAAYASIAVLAALGLSILAWGGWHLSKIGLGMFRNLVTGG